MQYAPNNHTGALIRPEKVRNTTALKPQMMASAAHMSRVPIHCARTWSLLRWSATRMQSTPTKPGPLSSASESVPFGSVMMEAAEGSEQAAVSGGDSGDAPADASATVAVASAMASTSTTVASDEPHADSSVFEPSTKLADMSDDNLITGVSVIVSGGTTPIGKVSGVAIGSIAETECRRRTPAPRLLAFRPRPGEFHNGTVRVSQSFRGKCRATGPWGPCLRPSPTSARWASSSPTCTTIVDTFLGRVS